ncbi:hypothetical protein HIM_11630 [Hirsutella minnesotensis 3608]|uniref:Uncharacterized protein n=1 Tax=Hirsutella minnesotensis 3608 TaxID=1043627 RepID=A0A0F7ZR45_9HYPO|nr:hypothetical protein HIM_11630 [Hirsutella minnesotensis 3608]
MSQSPYILESVKEDGGKEFVILEDGHVTRQNVSKFHFKFTKPSDITESINKRTGGRVASFSVTKSGRVGYTSMSCVYPDNTTSSKVLLTGCIFQYREKAKSDYGSSYVCMGVPEEYITQFILSARKESSVNLQVSEKFENKNGYYWVNAKTDGLSANSTLIMYVDEDGLDQGIPKRLPNVLADFKSNILADVCCVVSGSMTTDTMQEKLNLENGQFNLTIKLMNIYIKDVSDVEGPTLSAINRQESETVEVSDRLRASSKLVEYAMGKLKIAS